MKKIKYGLPLSIAAASPYSKAKQRFLHLYVLGKPRQGKTTLLLNLIQQELENGMIVIDPAGSFALSVAGLAPKERLIYIDVNNPLSINPLDRHLSWTKIALEFIEVMNIYIIHSTSTAQATVGMNEVIREAIRVFYHEKNLEKIRDFLRYPHERSLYWKNNLKDKFWSLFDDKKNQEAVLTAKRVAIRISNLLTEESAPFLLGESQFSPQAIAEQKKIVVFNLSGFSSEERLFLGCVIMNQCKAYYLYEATEASPPLFIYCDEFHLYISETFDTMLTECPKYNISVNISHHNHEQITRKTLSAILGGIDTLAVFKCNYEDARLMARELQISPEELVNLSQYHCWIRLNGQSQLFKTKKSPEIKPFIPPKAMSQPEPAPTARVAPEPANNLPKVNFLKDCWFPV